MPSSSPLRHSLLSLPAALLDAIRAYAITAVQFPSSIGISEYRMKHLPHTFPLLTCLPGITYVNKAKYRELVPYFLSRPRIIVTQGNDMTYFNAFLDHLGIRDCIVSLEFPNWSTTLQNAAVPGRDAHFLHTLQHLRELSLTVSTKDVMSFCMPDFAPQTVIYIERCAGKWGLLNPYTLPALRKFTMKCKVDDISTVAVNGFKQLVEWVHVHFTFDDDVKEVRKRMVELSDLIVVVITILKKEKNSM